MADLRTYPDIETLSSALADAIVQSASKTVAARGKFLLVLNGGGTPQGLFNLWGRAPWRDADFWEFTEIFWGDERCVPPDQAGSSYKQAADAFLGAVPIPEAQIHRIKGELDPETAAREYAATLEGCAPRGARWPRFDLVLLGMGNDGHTASLFPGPIFDFGRVAGKPPIYDAPGVIAVTAHYEDRPAQRVTLTAEVFNDARQVFFMATGASKSDALRAVLNGPYLPETHPAQSIRPHNGAVTWWVDEAAAGRLASVT